VAGWQLLVVRRPAVERALRHVVEGGVLDGLRQPEIMENFAEFLFLVRRSLDVGAPRALVHGALAGQFLHARAQGGPGLARLASHGSAIHIRGSR